MTTQQGSTFQCNDCGATFEVVREDAEAWAEAKVEFGPLLQRGECVVVCTACYDVIMAGLRTVH